MLIAMNRNDIVLLSLVRSNKHHSIGFLSNENRACVALSRAKRGFYLFGNAELLACESWTWGQVVNIMMKTKRPMLKALKAVPVSRAPPFKSRGIPRSGSPDKWHAYVNGGAKQDDARILQVHKEENAAFQEQRHNSTPRPAADSSAAHASPSVSDRLIETSPQKPAPSVSSNTGLLLDLDINSTCEAHPQQPSRASYATAVQSEKKRYGGSQFSLLD
ncbi:hypothetical protein N0V86_009767 [Didymella sp. IMI 355093]|nr:hypothetical protein N0V86_009767 [Didymella sp. IMI 355093]